MAVAGWPAERSPATSSSAAWTATAREWHASEWNTGMPLPGTSLPHPGGPRPDRRRFLGFGLAAAAAAVPLALAACGGDDDGGSRGEQETGGDVGTTPGPGRPERIVYGEGESRFGDLWLPAGEGPHPAVVLIHGGFWRSQYDVTLMDGLAADVVERGWVAWNIEYRRVGEAGGGWPGTLQDVADAFDHLAVLANDPSSPIDATRVAVAGHSAGGHLAEAYVTTAREAGDVAVLAPFDGDHFPVLDPTHESWVDTVAWLDPYLHP